MDLCLCTVQQSMWKINISIEMLMQIWIEIRFVFVFVIEFLHEIELNWFQSPVFTRSNGFSFIENPKLRISKLVSLFVNKFIVSLTMTMHVRYLLIWRILLCMQMRQCLCKSIDCINHEQIIPELCANIKLYDMDNNFCVAKKREKKPIPANFFSFLFYISFPASFNNFEILQQLLQRFNRKT